tara:strand:- start:36 stop:1160 length:1125 start_codon:yes stop_codon:yes gene_type:complete
MTSNARELAQIPSTPSGRRNLIINGAKQVFQRSTSATGVTTDIYAAPDRWKTRVFSTAEFTISQSTDVPSGQGFASSCKWDCTTANASPSSTTFLIYEQRIEGQDLQRLAYGTSSAKSLTASFWVKSNKTGAYTVGLYSPDGSRHIESSYTISSANTWEKKTITFAGDTGGTINDDNGEGMRIWFHLGAGSNWSSGTHATTWSAYSQGDVLVDNQVNLSDSTSNEWYITGIQLEVGSVATEFEHQKYCDVYKDCQRYYYKSGDNATSSEEWFPGVATNAGKGPYYAIGLDGINDRAYPALQWPVQMRAAPSITFYPGRSDSTATADRIVRYNDTALVTFTQSPVPYSNGLTGYFLGTSADSPAYAYQVIAEAEL